MKTIVIVTGGFDPIHAGHIAYLESAAQLGDRLIVGVNSDQWLTRKKGRKFMAFEDRVAIVKALGVVDTVVDFDDSDGSARDAIVQVRSLYPDARIIFANGGDRTQDNIPEMSLTDSNLEFVFGVGGENKMNSSSWILEEWKAPKTERPWGYYRVLHEVPGMKVKELTVDPGCSLSMQRHSYRSEHWIVSEGECRVNTVQDPVDLAYHETHDIDVSEWHQLTNPFDKPCRIVEIQFGERCEEEDIERK